MRTAKLKPILSLVLLAGLSSPLWAVEATPGADGLPGTWECYGPGQRSPRTPPIVYFGGVQTDGAGATTIFVDGFAREVNGQANVASEAGSMRVSAGASNLVLREFSELGAIARMKLDREGVGTYQCYRLPRLGEAVAESAQPTPPQSPQPAQNAQPSAPQLTENAQAGIAQSAQPGDNPQSSAPQSGQPTDNVQANSPQSQ